VDTEDMDMEDINTQNTGEVHLDVWDYPMANVTVQAVTG